MIWHHSFLGNPRRTTEYTHDVGRTVCIPSGYDLDHNGVVERFQRKRVDLVDVATGETVDDGDWWFFLGLVGDEGTEYPVEPMDGEVRNCLVYRDLNSDFIRGPNERLFYIAESSYPGGTGHPYVPVEVTERTCVEVWMDMPNLRRQAYWGGLYVPRAPFFHATSGAWRVGLLQAEWWAHRSDNPHDADVPPEWTFTIGGGVLNANAAPSEGMYGRKIWHLPEPGIPFARVVQWSPTSYAYEAILDG